MTIFTYFRILKYVWGGSLLFLAPRTHGEGKTIVNLAKRTYGERDSTLFFAKRTHGEGKTTVNLPKRTYGGHDSTLSWENVFSESPDEI